MEKNKGKIILLIILIIQCMYMVYWGTQKSGYYVDEFFTYDNAHYISQSTPKRQKLYDADYMEYGKWFTAEELKSTLMVQKDEALLNDSFIHNVKSFVYTKPYMAILNYVEAIFFEGELNWWSSIIINIIFFLINQIVLYKLVMKISGKQTSAFLTMLIYGFCGMAVSMLVYVRFYMYATLLITLFTYLSLLIWDNEMLWRNIIFELLSLITLYIAFRNSPLCAIYGASIVIGISAGLIIKRDWIKFSYYTLPIMLIGVLYVVFMTDYLSIFLNPQQMLAEGNLSVATSGLISELVALNGSLFIDRVIQFLHIVCRFLFGHTIIVLVYALAFVILLILYVYNSKKEHKKNNEVTNAFNFIYIITGAVIIYTFASIGFNLSEIRYNSFIFPMISLCVAVILMKLAENINKEKVLLIFISCAVIGEVFFTAYIPRIENLYIDDREGIEAIRECKGINSVVIDYKFDDRVMYECIAYTDEQTKIMFMKYEDMEYTKLGDFVLIWQSVNDAPEDLESDLIKAGYKTVQSIACTHESKVFLCMK